MPVKIRGVEYPDVKSAATALGVSIKTVHTAKRKGRLDFVGMGPGLPMSVIIRGVYYSTVREAAKALGVSTATVHCAMSRRCVDTLGLGKGNRTDKRGGRPKKPVRIGAYEWESRGALARDIGWDRRHVATILRCGSDGQRDALLRRVIECQIAKAASLAHDDPDNRE